MFIAEALVILLSLTGAYATDQNLIKDSSQEGFARQEQDITLDEAIKAYLKYMTEKFPGFTKENYDVGEVKKILEELKGRSYPKTEKNPLGKKTYKKILFDLDKQIAGKMNTPEIKKKLREREEYKYKSPPRGVTLPGAVDISNVAYLKGLLSLYFMPVRKKVLESRGM